MTPTIAHIEISRTLSGDWVISGRYEVMTPDFMVAEIFMEFPPWTNPDEVHSFALEIAEPRGLAVIHEKTFVMEGVA